MGNWPANTATVAEINDIGDVDITLPVADNDSLEWDGSNWVNRVPVRVQAMGEPMGFEDASQWTAEYDPTTQEVTLTPTGTQYIWVKGIRYAFSTPQVNAHTNATGVYYLQLDDTGTFAFDADFDFFNKAQASVVVYDTAQTPAGYSQAELHGIVMDAASHAEFHQVIGTYRISGGGFTAGSYTIYSPSDSTNPTLATITPAVPATVVKDEDLETTLPALPDGGPYTVFRKDWVATSFIWSTSQAAPMLENGSNVPQYNPSSGGAALVNMTNDSYICVYCLGIPVVSDAASQLFRYVWVLGQKQYTPTSPNTAQRTVALNQALAEDPNSLDNLDLTGIPATEYCLLAKAVYHYRTNYSNNDYRMRLEGYQALTGTRASLSAQTSGTSASIFDTGVSITTASAVGGLDPAVETNQKLVNERYAAFGYLGAWGTGLAYRIGNVVKVDHKIFRCLVAHTAAASFYTDLNAGNWELSASGGLAGKVTTTDATVTTVFSTAVPTDVSCKLSLKVSAFESATGDARSWELEYHLQNDSGTVTIQQIAERGYEVAGSTTWVAECDVSGTSFRLRVTGEAAHTIDWNSICEHSYF